MLTIVVGISTFAAGFIIGAVVVDRIWTTVRTVASVQTSHEHRYPVDLSPSDYFRMCEGQ